MKTTFQDGDLANGIAGTIVAAAFLNALNNHRHMGTAVDGDGAIDWAADVGAANAYVIALNPPLAANVVGMPVRFKAANANTSPSTLNICALGAVAIKKGVSRDLAAGDILAGQMIEVIYDGMYYQLMSDPGLSTSRFGADTGAANAYAVALSPAITAPVAGMSVCFKAAHANTGASTLSINGGAAISISKLASQALAAGDIDLGQIVEVVYDGAYWQLMTANFFINLTTGSGYACVELPGGLMFQSGMIDWGVNEAEGSYGPYSFPEAFQTALYGFGLTTLTPSTPGQGNAGDNVVQISTGNEPTLTQFSVFNNCIVSSTNASRGFYWWALGK